ncbi:ABC transporter ATP-binding protein, partial [Chloroflexota bacterium]
RLFDDLTVLENVLIGGHLQSKIGLGRIFFTRNPIPKQEIEEAITTLEFVGLSDLKNQLPSSLPHGHQTMLDIAIAMASKPKLLLLDEPLGGMSADEISSILNLIGKLRQSGTTILLVEHNMRAVMETCDRITVLNFGRKIAEGSPDEIAHNKEVIEAYLGVEEDYGA